MLRFAQSPTGDMNLGNLQVAIFNYIMSKQLKEDLLIRIDDTDKEKNIEGKEKDILEILSLFSIDHKHVVYQSENLKYHQKAAMQLMSKKNAFACFCSDDKINELKEDAKSKNKIYGYDGFCSTLSDETVLNCNAPFVVRIQKPVEKISFTDFVKGHLEYTPIEVDSLVILKHDKTPTYNYACAIDDMIYDISTVVRNEEHVSNTAKQIHVRNTLGYPKNIDYIHLPTLLNASVPVQELIKEGFLPSAIANYLVLLGNNTATEIFSLEEAIEWFDIKNIPLTPATFDIEKLRLINTEHLKIMDDMRLSKILGFADTDIGMLAKIYLDESNTINEIKSKLDAIFAPKDTLKGFKEELTTLKACLQEAPFINNIDDLRNYITEQTGLKGESLVKPLQYVLTGATQGPSLADIYPLIKNYIREIVK